MNIQERHLLEQAAKACTDTFQVPSFRFDWEKINIQDRADIMKQAEEYAAVPYPMRLASGFLAYVRSGSRKADEESYFLRRKKLCWAALSCCLGKKEALDQVVDGLWCICEESTWVISAHNVNAIPGAPKPAEYPLPDPDQPYVDLFSAQTGMILTLVRRMLEPELNSISPILCRRITREIRKRILDPFLFRNDFWWMGWIRKDLCNWTPWIVSNVMLCGLAEPMESDERTRVLIRCCGMLDRWLDVMPEDGGCDEGVGYWNMAGGSLLDCLELLEKASGGHLILWDHPKIRNILSFPAKAEIGNGFFLNFADCDARPWLSGERIQAAGERTKDPALISLGCRLRGLPSDELSDVPHFSRLLARLFHPAPENCSLPEPSDLWLPDLQIRMVRRNGWILTVKGGHNGESHNHNDVGSFMLYADGDPEIVDAGNMVYTARTFSDQRYELWNTRSAFHNVPLIARQEQQAGQKHRARQVVRLENGLRLDMALAYSEEAGVRTCLRQAELDTDGLRVADQIELEKPGEVIWVFLYRKKPSLKDGLLSTDRVRLKIPEGWQTAVEEIPVTDPRMSRSWPGSLWRVRIAAPCGDSCSVVWNFRKITG